MTITKIANSVQWLSTSHRVNLYPLSIYSLLCGLCWHVEKVVAVFSLPSWCILLTQILCIFINPLLYITRITCIVCTTLKKSGLFKDLTHSVKKRYIFGYYRTHWVILRHLCRNIQIRQCRESTLPLAVAVAAADGCWPRASGDWPAAGPLVTNSSTSSLPAAISTSLGGTSSCCYCSWALKNSCN